MSTRRGIPVATPASLVRIAILGAILSLMAGCTWLLGVKMPGMSYRGPLPPLTDAEATLAEALRRDVETLAGAIGERNVFHFEQLDAAAAFIDSAFAASGYDVHRQEFEAEDTSCANLEVEIPGSDRAAEIVIVGAHYDSVIGSPGANDNATGVAAMLALAGAFAGQRPSRTLRFVAFVNEEPPLFQTPSMGSLVYAQRCRARHEQIVAMVSLETIGYYSDEPKSQVSPFPLGLFYPSRGNFIGIGGNLGSRRLVRELVASFRRHTRFPCEGGAMPGFIAGFSWSDHWSFWRQGYPGVMVTDTALFRYPAYHTERDTPEKVDYARMARVVAGLERVLAELVNPMSGAGPRR